MTKPLLLAAIATTAACTLGPPVLLDPGPRITGLTSIAEVATTLAELGFLLRDSDESGLTRTEWRSYSRPYGHGIILVRDRVQVVLSPTKGALVRYDAQCSFISQPWGLCRDLHQQTIVRDTLQAEYEQIRAALLLVAQ